MGSICSTVEEAPVIPDEEETPLKVVDKPVSNLKDYGKWPAFDDLELFSLTKDVVYFDNPSYTLKHGPAVDAGNKALKQSTQVWTRDPSVKQGIKETFAKLVNGKAEDVAMFPCISYGMSLLASNLEAQLEPGDKILVVKGQVMANMLPWQELCERKKSEMMIVDSPADILTANWDRVKVCATFVCGWCDGAVTNLFSVQDFCEQHDAKLIVDATQAMGVMTLDVQRIKPHAICTEGHKWLGGVHGVSLMWLDPTFRKGFRPLDHDMVNRKNPGECDSKVGYNNELRDDAGCLDAGGRPNPTILPVLNVSIAQVLKWQPNKIAYHGAMLTAEIAKRAEEMGMKVPENHAPHIIGIRYPAPGGYEKTEKLQKYLEEHKIYTSFRMGFIRIGIWVYNTNDDVERFFAAIETFEEELQGKEVKDVEETNVDEKEPGNDEVDELQDNAETA